MKRKHLVLILILAFAGVGFGMLPAKAITYDQFDDTQTLDYSERMPRNRGYGSRYGMMGSNFSSRYDRFGVNNSNGCHGNYSQFSSYDGEEKLPSDTLRTYVEDYLDKYYPNDDLEISDVFEFKETDYYFSIEEEKTGRGAFELLVNPYTGEITHEQGPNMMWNDKYGMMNQMMGYSFNSIRDKEIGLEQAVTFANEYIKNYRIDGYVEDEGHQFYGYYTLHIKKGNQVTGMLSVNAYTGESWLHSWHDEVVNVYSLHDDH